MALPLALLQGLSGLRGAAGGIMPAGMSIGQGIGALGAAGAAGVPAMGSSLSMAPSAAPASVPSAAPAAPTSTPNYSLPPHLEGGGGAHDTGGSTQVANISPGAAGATVGASIPSLGNISHTSTPLAPESPDSGNEPAPFAPRPERVYPGSSGINPYINSTGGANASYPQYAGVPSMPPDRSMSPYAPGIRKGAGDYRQNTGAGLPGPETIDDLMKTLPGEPTPLGPDYNPNPYYQNQAQGVRLADAGNGVYGNSTGGASALSATGYPGGFPTGTLTPADAQAAPFSVPSYSRTVSPTSVPGSYQPPGYLGGQNEDVSRALPTLSPTSQPGFYHPPSITSGTGGANRGAEPDLYGGVFTPGDLGLGGTSPATAAPAAPSYDPLSSIRTPTPSPFSPITPKPFDSSGWDLMNEIPGIPQQGFAPYGEGAVGARIPRPRPETPGFLEGGGASHPVVPSYGTARIPQYRPSVPGANPRPQQAGDITGPSNAPPPYSDVGGPRVPNPRQSYIPGISPFTDPRLPTPRPDLWSPRFEGYWG